MPIYAPLRALLAPPVFDDEEKTRVARLLNILLLTCLLAAVLVALTGFVFDLFITGWVLTAGGVSIVGMIAMARRGYQTQASLAFLAILLTVITFLQYVGQGIHDVASMVYPIIIIQASLLLSRRFLVLFTVLCILTLGGIVFAEISGRIVTDFGAVTSIADFFFATIIVVVSAVCMRLVMGDLTRNLRRARRNEKALQASEEMFSKAFRVSPDAIVISSLPDGEILDVNDSFGRISGFDRDEVIGCTTLDLGVWVDPTDRARILDLLRTEGRVRDYECLLRTKSSAIRLCLDSAEIIDLEGKQRLISVIRDITEQKQAAEEREHLITELEARNAELERFTYTVSHDLKTPLVTIKGFLGLLEQDAAAGNTERMERDIAQIANAADTMAQLLSELLELSRVGRQMNAPEAVALSSLATEAASLVAGRIMARGVLVEIDPSMPSVHGDRVRLLEVYQNLLDNAVKFMGDQAAPRIEIGAQARNGAVACYVRDNGIGIDAKYHENVFGLFNRLDHAAEGTGIGLALVRRIVEVHGGKIWVESEGENTGSTFLFTLPLAAEVEYGDS